MGSSALKVPFPSQPSRIMVAFRLAFVLGSVLCKGFASDQVGEVASEASQEGPTDNTELDNVDATEVGEVSVEEVTSALNDTSLRGAAEGRFCQKGGGVCGGPGHLPRKCCDGLACQTLQSGGGKRVCEPPLQCLPAFSECKGALYPARPCCGNAKCEFLVGAEKLRCIEVECVALGETCGKIDGRTVKCCKGICRKESPVNLFSAERCM